MNWVEVKKNYYLRNQSFERERKMYLERVRELNITASGLYYIHLYKTLLEIILDSTQIMLC